MKAFKINILILTMITFVIASCSRDIPHIAVTDQHLEASSTLQVFNATVKSVRTYVYVDNVPVSGAAVAQGGIFPGTAFAFKVAPGSHTILIKDTLSTSTQTPITFTQQFDAGKMYTTFMYDTISAAKQVTVENKIAIPTDTTRPSFALQILNTTMAEHRRWMCILFVEVHPHPCLRMWRAVL